MVLKRALLLTLCMTSYVLADQLEMIDNGKGPKWRKRVFSHIYTSKHWWDGESFSGPGSSEKSTTTLSTMLPGILKSLPMKDGTFGARVFLDAGCGDFNWMRSIVLTLGLDLYIGTDIVASLIEKNQEKYSSDTVVFLQLDVVEDELPAGVDVIMCRDVLAHLSYEDIGKALRNFKKSGAQYLLASSFSAVRDNNLEMMTGNFRSVNLECAPFSFPEPLFSIFELSSEAQMVRYGKRICLWRIADLPIK